MVFLIILVALMNGNYIDDEDDLELLEEAVSLINDEAQLFKQIVNNWDELVFQRKERAHGGLY